MAFKKCSSCDSVLSVSKFGPNRSRKDNLQPYCRSCMKSARKKSAKTEKSKESARARQKKYRERLKEKNKKNKLIKVRTKSQDSVTKGRRKQSDSLKQERRKITLNPKPIKKNGDL